MISDGEAMDRVRDAVIRDFVSKGEPAEKRQALLGALIDAIEGTGRALIDEIKAEPMADNDDGRSHERQSE